MGAADSDAFGVLDRMTAIFEAFDEDDHGLRISELAQRADLPKSTVSRLVSTLVRQRYLERDGTAIHLGLRLFELGQLADEPRELRGAALPVMADLRNRTGETAYLAIRDAQEMMCVAIVRGPATAPLISRIGGRFPAHATALGKAVLAFSAPADVDAVVAAGLTAWTHRTIIDDERLAQQLAGVRESGFATEIEELITGVCGVASPVFSPAGGLIASISVSGPAGEFDPGRSASAVRGAALALTRRLAPGAAASS